MDNGNGRDENDAVSIRKWIVGNDYAFCDIMTLVGEKHVIFVTRLSRGGWEYILI